MYKLILTAILVAGISMAGVIQNTISVTSGTTNAATDFIDIGDQAQTVRQIDSMEFYVLQPTTNTSTTVELRQEMIGGQTNILAAYTVAGNGATNSYPRRGTEPYAVNRAFFYYSFARATNSTQAVGATNSVYLQYKILTR